MVNTREYNKKRFSIFESEEKTALELMNELGQACNEVLDRADQVEILANDNKNNKVSYNDLHTKYQLTTDGATANFNGTWQGLEKPTLSQEGAAAQTEKNTTDIIKLTSNFEQLNSNSVTKQELEVEKNRIDLLTALQNGQTEGNSELLDIRNGADGIVYTNAGQSVRTQIKNIENEITNVIGDKIKYEFSWIDGGYINNTNGAFVTSEAWKYTDFIEIKNYSKLLIETTQQGSTSYNAFYDKNKTFISTLNISSSTVTVPTNAVYFRLSNAKQYNTVVRKSLEGLNSKVNEIYVTNKINGVKEIINLFAGDDITYSYDWITGGYINNVDGTLIKYDGWKYTDYIDLKGATKLNLSSNQQGSTSYNAFYTADKVFISNFSVANSSVDVPNNAAYMRLSVSTNSTTLLVKNTLDKAVDIISLNKDIEPYLIQASEGLGQMFTNKTSPLVFTHFSDVHTIQELWNRIIEFNNYYSKYIKFSIHTGDYCGGNQTSYVDLYQNGIGCNIPVFNCVGNHDTYTDNLGTRGLKKTAHDLLFNHSTNWNVTFMDIDNSMTYYKDFADNKIRFIVLDYYYDIDAQCTWLLERLNGAKALGYHVVTCMHEMTNVIINKLDTTFQTIDNFESLGGNKYSISKFDKVIGDWKKTGGIHVANFAGHEHSDFIGYTENDVLNICVQSATDNVIWTDGKRVKGTKTWDCFNLVAVDVATNNLKIVRIGNNVDHYLREKKVLSYDYVNKKIIS